MTKAVVLGWMENKRAFQQLVAMNMSSISNYANNIFGLEASMPEKAEQVDYIEQSAVIIRNVLSPSETVFEDETK